MEATEIRKVHCLFEQSGTFKQEFLKLGISAEDYDIQNNFNQTDHVVDLFAEIEKAYSALAGTEQNRTEQNRTEQNRHIVRHYRPLSRPCACVLPMHTFLRCKDAYISGCSNSTEKQIIWANMCREYQVRTRAWVFLWTIVETLLHRGQAGNKAHYRKPLQLERYDLSRKQLLQTCGHW